MDCFFPCFPEAQCLISTFVRTCPVFPGMTPFHGVCPLFPDLSSEVLIMGLEIVVAVMIALSKSANHQVKQSGYRGSMNMVSGPSSPETPQDGTRRSQLLPELVFQRKQKAGRPSHMLMEHIGHCED